MVEEIPVGYATSADHHAEIAEYFFIVEKNIPWRAVKQAEQQTGRNDEYKAVVFSIHNLNLKRIVWQAACRDPDKK